MKTPPKSKSTGEVFILMDRQMALTRAVPLHRTEHEGETFITASDMKVYISHPLLNLWTGETKELWLTQDQIDSYRERACGMEQELHPRMFDLPTLGLPTYQDLREARQKGKPKIEGWTGPSTCLSVVQDGGGHWWSGSIERSNIKHYFESNPMGKFRPVLRFAYPWLRYLGADGDEMMREPNYASRQGGERQIILCTDAVAGVIKEMGMWGLYSPKGEARHTPSRALKQMKILRAPMLLGVQLQLKQAMENQNETEPLLKQAQKDLNVAQMMLNEAQQALAIERDKTKLHTRIEELVAEVAQLKDTNWSLTNDLEAARTATNGFNLSRV